MIEKHKLFFTRKLVVFISSMSLSCNLKQGSREVCYDAVSSISNSLLNVSTKLHVKSNDIKIERLLVNIDLATC